MTFSQHNTIIFSCARSWYDILLFYFILIHKELTHASLNIFTISLCIHCTYNVNLYYRHIKIGKFCTHLQNLYNIYHFFFLSNVYNICHFLCLRCKLTLQVYNQLLKILQKQKQKQKQSSNQLRI